MERTVLILVAIGVVGVSFCMWMAYGVDAVKRWRGRMDENSKAKKYGVFMGVMNGNWEGAKTFSTRHEATFWAQDMASRGHDCTVYQLLERFEHRYIVRNEKFD